MNSIVLCFFISNIGCYAYNDDDARLLSTSIVNEGEYLRIRCDLQVLKVFSQNNCIKSIIIRRKKISGDVSPVAIYTIFSGEVSTKIFPPYENWNIDKNGIEYGEICSKDNGYAYITLYGRISSEHRGVYTCEIYVQSKLHPLKINETLIVRRKTQNFLSKSIVNEGEPMTIICAISNMEFSKKKYCINWILITKKETSGAVHTVAMYGDASENKKVLPPYNKKWNISMEGLVESEDCSIDNGHAMIVAKFLATFEDSGEYLCRISDLFNNDFLMNGTLIVRRSSPKKGVSSFGSRFHLAFPEAHPEVKCSLYTKEFESFNVSQTVSWYSEKVTPVIYALNNSKPTNINLRLRFGTRNLYQLRFTYILEAQFDFQVMCYSFNIHQVPHSVMMAVPVQGFGRIYVLPSIPFQPSVQIVSSEEELSVTIEISYISSDGKELKTYLAQTDSAGVIYLLKGSLSLSVDLCRYENSTLKGGLIKGSNNFGVIIGACTKDSVTNPFVDCPPDFGIDMLLPVTEYFKLFIIALPKYMPANIIISFTGVTKLSVDADRKEDSNSSEISRNLGIFWGIHVITVSRASYVSAVLHAPCQYDQSEERKVMFNSILPYSLFIDTYLWVTEFYNSHQQYIVVIYKKPNEFTILLDGFSIYRTLGPEKYQNTVLNRYNFCYVVIESTPGRHQLYSVNANKFGAYLLGTEIQKQTQLFITPLGFAAQPGVRWGKMDVKTTEEERCDVASREKELSKTDGDYIDNDCDFLVDEEMKDGIDNDKDGKIDEDNTLPFIRNGEWTNWDSWQCLSKNINQKFRTRTCTNPKPTYGGYNCEGLSMESKEHNCKQMVQGIVDGEMKNVAVECLCDERLGNLSMANLTRECIPPRAGGSPCQGEKEIVGPEDTCPKSCFKKEICLFERNTDLATRLDSNYTKTNIKADLKGCIKACQNQDDCQGFTISTKNPDKPECWLFHRLLFGKEDESYESYIQKCNMVCEGGYFSPEYKVKGYTTCRKCPTGTYKNVTSPGPCFLCPANWTTLYTGSTSISDCSIVSIQTVATMTTPKVDTIRTKDFTVFVTMTPKKHYPGNWGGWSKWSCVENCTVTSLIRTRPCLDPPQGPRDLDCPGFAYQLDSDTACNTICSTVCPEGLWGFNCSKKCPNCERGCDKETGICSRCKPGFRYPLKSCSQACGEMTYGYDCSGDCPKHCQGKDCIERVHGNCPPTSIWKSNWWYAALVLLIIPIIVIGKLSGQAARRQYEMTEANNLFDLEYEDEVKSNKLESETDTLKTETDASIGTNI